VRRQHDQGSIADQVPVRAVHGQVVLRVARDSTLVLLVAGVAENNNALDLVDHRGGECGDRACNDSCALTVDCELALDDARTGMGVPVTTGNNRGVRALRVGKLEETGALGNGSSGRALGRKVFEKAGSVRAAYALDPHIRGTVVGLERIGEDRPGLFALWVLAVCTMRYVSVGLRRAMTRATRTKNRHRILTMFPSWMVPLA
jgi:hypothetical protein